MLPQNTFLIKQTEKLESESSFINILCPQLLQFINESFFDSTVIFNSSPGGGKTTLLKTFSPEVLLELKANNGKETYKDTYNLLNNLDVIDDKEIKILGVNISCARDNYCIIDDLYDDGKAVQVFFELLSLRILKKILLSVLKCNQLEEESLEDISFKNVPDEWKSTCSQYSNGKLLYQWAVEKEDKLCNSIEEMCNEIRTSMMFNNLSVLTLIGNGNIMLFKKPIRQKVLVMFDDFNALSTKQRKELRNGIFKLRPNLAIWMAQRLIALTEEEIFGSSGRIHREYNIVNIDEIIRDDKKNFYAALKNVADRRVALTYKEEGIEDKLEKTLSKKNKDKLFNIHEKIKQRIKMRCSNDQNFNNIFCYLENKQFSSEWERVVYWQVLHILVERAKQNPQMVLPFMNLYSIEQFDKEYEKLHKNAEYLIRYNYKLPIYFGVETLQVLSSYNVEQFLDFAGELFELRIALDYVSKKKKATMITQEEQEKAIIKCADEKWDDISRTFSMGKEIQLFISNVAKMGCENLKKNTASYSGGTYTGIGIKMSENNSEFIKEKSEKLLRMLKICVSYNLLICQDVKQGTVGSMYKVFYLNRWICVKFKLPLGYGGWKPLSMDSATKLLYENGE